MSSCLLYDQNFLCEGLASVPGIAEIYVTNRRNLGYWYYLETSPYQYGEIIGNELPATWFKIYMRQQSCNFNQSQSKDVSRLYNQTLSLFWNKISFYKRDRIEEMVVNDDLVAIFKDKNGKWWLIGETSGVSVDTWNFTTGDKGGSNETSIIFDNNERYPIREVDTNYVDQIITCALMLCDLTLDDLCVDSLDSLCGNCAILQ